ncbi:hypothetical protein BV898_14337 [Hypsibius exemplaris]|uniref:Uncharacterized protein n=1 Tax=Hypsibius exemplaris TaxID=2072580 RepID=A0A9X6N8K6_HYPEX|nr:hypothetical protein BV898_14337 [Hypsibius exemplaris]
MPTDKPSGYTVRFVIERKALQTASLDRLRHQKLKGALQPDTVSDFGGSYGVCNFALQDFEWGSSAGSFNASIQATFDDNTTNAIGVAALAMTMDRMREIDFIYPSTSVHYVIAVCEKHLVSAGDGAFFVALFAGVPVIATFTVIALIFVLLAGLITSSEMAIKQLSAPSSKSSGISVLTHSLFRLYTIAFGQATTRIRMFSDDVAFTRSTPRSLYGLYTVWFFMVTVIGAVVCSLLPSYLTVSTAQLPFTDLQSFQRSGYNLMGPPLAFKLLNESSDPVKRTLANEIQVVPLREEKFFDCADRDEALHGDSLQKTAFANIAGLSHLSPRCQTSVIAVSHLAHIFIATFFTTKRSHLRNNFTREYLVLQEHGLVQHLDTLQYYTIFQKTGFTAQQAQHCRTKAFVSTSSVSRKSIGWRTLAFGFWFCAASAGVSVYVLVIERMINSLRNS